MSTVKPLACLQDLSDTLGEFYINNIDEGICRVECTPHDRDALIFALRAIESLRWLVYLHHGVSKGGGSPTPNEWDDAYSDAEMAIESLERIV